MKKLLMIAALLSIAASAGAQIAISGPTESTQYARTDYTITLDAPRSAEVDLVFTAPDGTAGTLPCFWEDGNWHARFAPAQAGEYTLKAAAQGKNSYSIALNVAPGTSKGYLHTDGYWILRYDDGTPFRGVGENLCWESRMVDDNTYFAQLHENPDLFSYSRMLPRLASNGGNFTRMWMCSWNFPIDRKADFNNRRYTPTDEPINRSAVENLDRTIDLAEAFDIKIMLCMGQGDVKADAAFFTTPEAKAAYKQRLRYIVARWGYSTSIAMWEFFNEIDNIQFKDSKNPIPAEYIVAWHDEMSRYLKGIDPYGHIRTTSISHRDLAGLNSLECIDINQKHIYRATNRIPEAINGYEKKFGKPYVIGEAGFEWDWTKDFNSFADGMDMDFRRAMWYGIFNPTPIAPMSWWWEFFQNRNTDKYIKVVRYISDLMLELGGGEFSTVKVSGGDSYAVKCGQTTFVYVFNDTEDTLNQVKIKAKGKISKLNPDTCTFDHIKNLKSLGLQPKEEGIYKIN